MQNQCKEIVYTSIYRNLCSVGSLYYFILHSLSNLPTNNTVYHFVVQNVEPCCVPAVRKSVDSIEDTESLNLLQAGLLYPPFMVILMHIFSKIKIKKLGKKEN